MRAATMLETKWVIFAGWSVFGFFLVGIGIGMSWGQTAIMAMVASFAIVSAIRIDGE
jgi:hypothetical protein